MQGLTAFAVVVLACLSVAFGFFAGVECIKTIKAEREARIEQLAAKLTRAALFGVVKKVKRALSKSGKKQQALVNMHAHGPFGNCPAIFHALCRSPDGAKTAEAQQEIVRLLLKAGSVISAPQMAPILHYATTARVCKALIEARADPEARAIGFDQWSTLGVAAARGRPEVVYFLVESGACSNVAEALQSMDCTFPMHPTMFGKRGDPCILCREILVSFPDRLAAFVLPFLPRDPANVVVHYLTAARELPAPLKKMKCAFEIDEKISECPDHDDCK